MGEITLHLDATPTLFSEALKSYTLGRGDPYRICPEDTELLRQLGGFTALNHQLYIGALLPKSVLDLPESCYMCSRAFIDVQRDDGTIEHGVDLERLGAVVEVILRQTHQNRTTVKLQWKDYKTLQPYIEGLLENVYHDYPEAKLGTEAYLDKVEQPGEKPPQELSLTEGPQREYDVALSFAGEDRAYAENLAECLQQHGISVFYDGYEQATLWGKDLYDHLAYVYKDASRYCVMFLSEHYANKLWATHERKSAQARAFRERKEYILPLRLDDTEIPGIPETIGYIDLRESSIDAVCAELLEKLACEELNAGPDSHSVAKDSAIRGENPHTRAFTSERFDKEGFRQLSSTGYVQTSFELNYARAGREARANPGAITKGDSLVIGFQDSDLSDGGLGVWLTVENHGDMACRWFGCVLTAYGHPEYVEIQPELHEGGGHCMVDIYPGEQYTCHYLFPFSPNIAGPKFLTCSSWDKPMTFWWARGA